MMPQIIYDDRHPDGDTLLLEELKNQGITDYRIWPAIVLPHSVVESINASHKMIVAHAKEQNLPEICIFEQDIMFIKDGWKYFLSQKPLAFDIYLGGTYGPVLNYTEVSAPIGLHCYIIRKQFYDNFLALPADQHIDQALWVYPEKKFRVCHPMVASQRPGFSFNQKKHVDYNKLLKSQP